MDLEKASDRVNRDTLWQVLRFYGVRGKLLKAVQSFHVDCKACVRFRSEVTEWFSANVAFRQGCVLRNGSSICISTWKKSIVGR